MGTTPVYAWPWPEYVDAADGATAVKNLAVAMDATIHQMKQFVDANDIVGRDIYAKQDTRTGAQMSLAGGWSQVPLDTVEYKTVTANQKEGWHLVSMCVALAPVGAVNYWRLTQPSRNAGTGALPAMSGLHPAGNTNVRSYSRVCLMYLTASDVLGMYVYHNNPSNLTTGTTQEDRPRQMAMFAFGPRPPS